MNYHYLTVTREKRLATLTLNRPDKRNAMNGDMIREIGDALKLLASDKTVSVLIINGNGEHFCAGADINWMKAVGTFTADENLRDAEVLANMLHQLYEFPKPTIALAHGAVLGGGMGIVSACDIALAAKNSSFGFPEVKMGIAPSTISPYVMRAIGEKAANYYFLTGTRFNAEEAERIGLIKQCVEDDELYQTGQTLAQTLLQNAPNALAAIKQLIHRVAHEKITPELSKITAKHLADIRKADEAQEGLKAFLEKRAPQWNEG
jgi:methylglutaconyl-CoA hydratase